VAYRPFKQLSLLGNSRNNRRTVFSVVQAMRVSVQRLNKHVPVAADMIATIEEHFLCDPC
jgi:hypothetical protein